MLMRQGLREICAARGGFDVVGDAGTIDDAVAISRQMRPDVVLMDLALSGMDSVDAVRRIVGADQSVRVIALTMSVDEAYMLGTVRAGVRAFLRKTIDADLLIGAINAVHRGEYLVDPILAARVLGDMQSDHAARTHPQLLPKEVAVLRLVAQGLDNREIAEALRYSEHTVSNRMRTIFSKIEVTSRTQAALYALRRGWASLDDAG
jgi:NarL family two-component system response regulator LiaR